MYKLDGVRKVAHIYKEYAYALDDYCVHIDRYLFDHRSGEKKSWPSWSVDDGDTGSIRNKS